MNLTEKELYNIEGGGFKLSAGFGIFLGGLISFLIGLGKGIMSPAVCK